MEFNPVRMLMRPRLENARMLLGFSGWMDGGEVSTGTVDCFADSPGMERLAEIDAAPFRIYNFPGSMEISSLFRPSTRIKDGVVQSYEEPSNICYVDIGQRLLVFRGREPHVQWKAFAEALFEVIDACNVRELCFIGSVAGLVPHTRAPRFHGSVADAAQLPVLAEHNISPSNYEGPASFVTYLFVLCRERGIRMTSAVAEVPAYIHGRNEKCIFAAVEKVKGLLGVELDTEPLRRRSLNFERKLHETALDQPDFLEQLEKMEQDYDRESPGGHIEELRAWFKRQDIRLN